MAIIGVFAAIVLANTSQTRESAYEARALNDFNGFRVAVEFYLQNNNWVYPDDVFRGIPAGLDEYLGEADWSQGPWPGSVYDWDNYIPSGETQTAYQMSIRFCPSLSSPIEDCNFPDQPWAANFHVFSSYFYCLEGPCRSHELQPYNHPGYCVNCLCKEMETC